MRGNYLRRVSCFTLAFSDWKAVWVKLLRINIKTQFHEEVWNTQNFDWGIIHSLDIKLVTRILDLPQAWQYPFPPIYNYKHFKPHFAHFQSRFLLGVQRRILTSLILYLENNRPISIPVFFSSSSNGGGTST